MVHLPFENRIEAGRLLARELSTHGLTAGNAVVLALVRGGVPVGFAVADRLRLPLDVIVARKLGVPWQPELAMGAIAGNTRILDWRMIRQIGISDYDLEDVISREQAEMRRREDRYRAGAPPLDVQKKAVVLVDDGLATGSTMLAAVRHLRTLEPARIIVAVPVGSGQACERLRREADEVVCLATPPYFFAVGEWYIDFQQVGDNEVRTLMFESREQLRKHLSSESRSESAAINEPAAHGAGFE